MQGESCLNYISLFLRADEADFSAGFRPVGDKKRQGGGGRPPWRRGTMGESGGFGRFLFLEAEEPLQGGDEEDAHQAGGEAAVIEQVAAVESRDASHQGVVEHTCHNTGAPAVLAGDGTQAVGIAQAREGWPGH